MPTKTQQKTQVTAKKTRAGTDTKNSSKAGKATPKKATPKKAAPAARKTKTPTNTNTKTYQPGAEDTMTKGTTIQFDKMAQDAANSSKENMDAVMQSGNIFMNGCEEIMKTCLSMTQEAADKNSKAVKSLMGCKTVNDLTEAQTKLIRQNFEDFIASTTKLSELSMKVATDSFAPLNTRLDHTVKKTRDNLAA